MSVAAAVAGAQPAEVHADDGEEKKQIGKRVKDAAIDTTGLEDRATSHHFRKRREETAQTAKNKGQSLSAKPHKSSFPKLALLCDCLSHLTLSLGAGRGPGADHGHFKPLLDEAAALFTILRLLADAGFDSEAHHAYARDKHGVVAIIPAQIGRPTAKPPTGKHRRRMKQQWDRYQKRYGRRWAAETINSMLKRLLGSALRAVKHWSRCREMILRVLTLNIMILAGPDG